MSSEPVLSVMIPSYGRPRYLAKTIESVLSQGLEDSQIQIEVVDDGTPGEAIKEVVERCGRGRVGYYKQAENVGAARNWNTCIERARGQWVHILHDDDWIAEGFYQAAFRFIEEHPTIVGLFTRGVTVDEQGEWLGFTPAPSEMERTGLLPNAAEVLARSSPFYPSGLLVRREAYECIGEFSPRYKVAYDWDMWVRLSHCGPIGGLWHPYLRYRSHEETLTHTHICDGALFRECHEIIVGASSRLPHHRQSIVQRQAIVQLARVARRFNRRLSRCRDYQSARVVARWWFRLSPSLRSLLAYLSASWRVLFCKPQRSM